MLAYEVFRADVQRSRLPFGAHELPEFKTGSDW
jgi:hypothetical protein